MQRATSKKTKTTESPHLLRTRKTRSLRRKDGLLRYAKNVTSQNGEDGIVKKIFQCIPHRRRRWCVDVGAWDGRHLSNTYNLTHPLRDEKTTHSSSSSWSGIFIEADATRCEDLRKLYEERERESGDTFLTLRRTVSCGDTQRDRLSSILASDAVPKDFPKDFDFLSVDVDGIDYWVLKDALEAKYRPKLICVEFNPTMPLSLVYAQAKSDDVRHGSSLSALVELANDHKYTLVETTLFNAFFVPNEVYAASEALRKIVPDTSVEALAECTMGTQIYQLYDGTLRIVGCKKLLWHRIPIQEAKIQMLSKEKRTFPFAPPSSSS